MADKNHAGYPSNSVTLVTNQIIKMLCFDATEPSNGNSDRRGYGNNRYIYSNLRQWLNSPAAAGQWYTAQHSVDQTPDSSHVWNGVNPYSGLAGFLNAFTANERAALLFLSTPSARRATRLNFRASSIVGYFYPRPPRGGRRAVHRPLRGREDISIHALREEGDS